MRQITLSLFVCLSLTACTVGIVERQVIESEPSATPTPTPFLVSTETATPTPGRTLTPSPSPTATATPTPPFVPSVPTHTITATLASCPIPIPVEFSRLYDYPEVLLALDCPLTGRQQTWAAEEHFQRGRMFWQEHPDTIYILYTNNRAFHIMPDLYDESHPNKDACPEVGGAPEGLFKPVRGFNRHWCSIIAVRQALGWALEEEVGYNAVWQEFEHGRVFQSRADHIFIFFYDTGVWGYIE